uniref:Endonuclease/exonuclease/phosphatase domain-containing protein n=1 Tax=Octopus bimaculoides TaxID=37653 RepID=A0A0L8I0H1_OCTBM
MKKRKRHCIIKFHKEKKEGKGRYRNLLMLYYPWRDEEIDLKADYPSYQEHYESVEATVHSNEAMFSVNGDELDRAYGDLKRMEPPEDAWDALAYVVLSHVRHLSGLFLIRFDATAIRTNPSVVREMDSFIQQTSSETLPSAAPTVTHGGLQIRLLNIRSYFEHEQDLKVANTLQNVDVFCFVETFFKPNQQVTSILPQTEITRADRPTALGRGGGVMTVAKQEITSTDIHLNVSGLEYTAVGVTISSTNINMITNYRSSVPVAPSLTNLDHLIRFLPRNHLTIVFHDFNVDLLDSSNHEILTTTNQFGFDQLVQKPTTTDYGSLLDHVYGNQDRRPQVTVTNCYFSDHDVVCVSLKF